MHLILILAAAICFDAARRRARAIRRRNATEAALFRLLGTEAGPRYWTSFPIGYKTRVPR